METEGRYLDDLTKTYTCLQIYKLDSRMLVSDDSVLAAMHLYISTHGMYA